MEKIISAFYNLCITRLKDLQQGNIKKQKKSLTVAKCGRRSCILYLSQAIIAENTCSSFRTFNSSLQMMSTN